MGEDVDMGTTEPSCDDGVRNQDESGVDCGGDTCETRCPSGAMCNVSADCDSGACIAGTCQGASCSDGVRNGMETDRDCGGPDCGGCGLGQACTSMDDCAMGQCEGGYCVADHCFNATRDANETDVDCGGPDCGPCVAGSRCSSDGDCAMGTCLDSFCRTAACTNGMMDAGEVGVDCGGECPGCADTSACTLDEDCLSNRCDMMVCTSCTDGIQNGTESDVDCGGSDCRPCFGGEACTAGTDCSSGVCNAGLCEGGAAYLDEDFTAGDGGWVSGGTNSSWEFGTPSTTNIDGAYTGTMVWVTNAAGDYNSSESSWVESPSMDLSAVTNDPTIQAAVFYRTEACCDEWWLELSVDGGTTWTKVVDDGTATNWYNDTSNEWWDGDLTDWTVVSAVLTGAAGNADVKVRFRVSSDSSFTDEGFAFDDVRIFEDLCANGILDAGEADIDCGGECGACTDGSDCVMDADCGSMRCEGGTCTSCRDGIQNGGEAAIDCGGGMCLLCGGGIACTDGSTCASGICDSGVCAAVPVFYENDFETDDGGFTASTGGSWAYGTPMDELISGAASGTSAWVTNLTGNYMNSENSYIESPVLDLSAAPSDPVLSFNLIFETEDSYDEGFVTVSVDGGTTWTRVVASATAVGWYNDTSNNWWTGTNGAWTEVSTVLAGTAGESDVRVRFNLSADISSVREGFGIDDVRIGPPAPNLEVTITPSATLCGAGLVSVTNSGSAGVSFFDLTTVVDGTSSTSRIMRALDPGQTFTATISAATSLSATASAMGDERPGDDTATLTIDGGIVVSSGMRYLETFEANDGGWVTAGTNTDWEWGEPDSSGPIGIADSGMNAWVTDLDGTYNSNQQSYLTSPCFDLSALGSDPSLSFSRIFELEATNDHVHVEVSLDGGVTWNKLGEFGTGTNWYNDILGDFWDGVSGANDVWTRSAHPLTGAAGRSQVRIRFAFVSNGSIVEDGFGVDDVIIQ